MGYDPKEPRDSSGKWSGGGESRSNVGQIKGSGKRWGRMNSTDKAKLEASARFQTNFKQGSKKSKGVYAGTQPKNLHVATVMTSDGPRMIYEPSKHAMAIQTAKALDRDFNHAKNKANIDSMHAALAKSNVPIVKYPSKKPKR